MAENKKTTKKHTASLSLVLRVLKDIETGKIKVDPPRELTPERKAEVAGWVKEVQEGRKRVAKAQKRQTKLLKILKDAKTSKKSSKPNIKLHKAIQNSGR